MYSLREELSKATKLAPLIGLDEHLNNLLIAVQGALFSMDLNRFEQFVLMDLVTDSGYTFLWHSKSTQSTCPRCSTISTHQRHTYKTRVVIDEEILGKCVTHVMRLMQYTCDHCIENEGDKTSFVEDVSMICRPYVKTTTALDEKIVNEGINRSANGLAQDYMGRIDVSRETILRRVKEAGGMVTEKNLTDTQGISALSVDDNNGRKGNPSSACTVVIDAETHNILVVAQGANSEVAKKVFDRFPDAALLSRDRACAYSKAGDECSLEQVADIFHLIENAHDAVKKGLSTELRHNLYIRDGDGWVELPANPAVTGSEDPVPVSSLTEDDIVKRIQLAHLTARQEAKYRKVIDLLRLYDEGLSESEIRKRLGLSWTESRKLLSEASIVINTVESKIDEYLVNSGDRQCRQKTISKNARHSSESIVEPYSETVMQMASAGHTHRSIHPVICKMGFEGSANAIYQYILKKRHESGIADKTSQADPNTGTGSAPQRPKRVSLQRVTKGSLYKYILHEVALERKVSEGTDSCDNSDPMSETSSADSSEATPTPTTNQASKSFYSEDIGDIVCRQVVEREPGGKKKRNSRLQKA